MKNSVAKSFVLKGSGRFLKACCLSVVLTLMTSSNAANLRLEPTTSVVNVLNGQTITFDIIADFSDTGGSLGGSLDINFDPDDLKLTDIEINPAAGESDFHEIEFITQITGLFRSWAIGAFDGLPDTLWLGTLSFEIKPTMGLDTTIATEPTSGDGGPWVSGTDFLTLLTPSYNHLVVSRTSGIGSECGDAILYTGETCDDGNANQGDGCSATCTVEPGYTCTLPAPGPVPSMCTDTSIDTDGDGVSDALDNCSMNFNAAQVDTDNDSYGNACDPDFNNDCVVNFLDYPELVNEFFSTTALLYDLNEDGVVNFLDIGIFTNFFMLTPGPSGITQLCN